LGTQGFESGSVYGRNNGEKDCFSGNMGVMLSSVLLRQYEKRRDEYVLL
jgi:hypothetical protein